MGRGPRWAATRWAVIGIAVAAVLAAIGFVGYRVFRPGELVDAAKATYPSTVPVAQPKVYGTLLASPLLVDMRLRVYAAKRDVYADTPVNVESSLSHFWSYRRWPAQVTGVVAVGATVVTLWSDGAVVALEAAKGSVVWRADVPQPPGTGFTGRRTGAATVYQPRNLLTAGSVVVVVGSEGTTAFDAPTGRQLWHLPPTRCQNVSPSPDSRASSASPAAGGSASPAGAGASGPADEPGGFATFTTPTAFVEVDTCGPPATAAVDAGTGEPRDWPQADLRPLGCATGRSMCTGVVAGDGRAWTVGRDGTLTPARGLSAPGTWLVDGVAVRQLPDGSVQGRRAGDDSPLWTSDAGTVVAVEKGAVHLMSAGHRELVTLNPSDGGVLSRFPFVVKDSGPFDLGTVYAADRFLFIERARPGAKIDEPDGAYFYPSPNVVVAGS
jgi:outer membrane protein assembly factor BamB